MSKSGITLLVSLLLSVAAYGNFNDQVNQYKTYEQGLLASQSASVVSARQRSRLNTEQNLSLVNHVIAMAKGSYDKNVPHGGRAAVGPSCLCHFRCQHH